MFLLLPIWTKMTLKNVGFLTDDAAYEHLWLRFLSKSAIADISQPRRLRWCVVTCTQRWCLKPRDSFRWSWRDAAFDTVVTCISSTMKRCLVLALWCWDGLDGWTLCNCVNNVECGIIFHVDWRTRTLVSGLSPLRTWLKRRYTKINFVWFWFDLTYSTAAKSWY